MAKSMKVFVKFKLLPNLRADLSIQGRKEFEGKIKLENKPTDRGYNYPLRVNIKSTR